MADFRSNFRNFAKFDRKLKFEIWNLGYRKLFSMVHLPDTIMIFPDSSCRTGRNFEFKNFLSEKSGNFLLKSAPSIMIEKSKYAKHMIWENHHQFTNLGQKMANSQSEQKSREISSFPKKSQKSRTTFEGVIPSRSKTHPWFFENLISDFAGSRFDGIYEETFLFVQKNVFKKKPVSVSRGCLVFHAKSFHQICIPPWKHWRQI